MANETARALRRLMTSHEVRVWTRLRVLKPQGLHFRRQVPIGPYIVDFACLRARLVVEIYGSQHGMPQHRAKDRVRDSAIEKFGFTILRFWNSDVDGSLQDVVEQFFSMRSRGCRKLQIHLVAVEMMPLPPLRRRGGWHAEPVTGGVAGDALSS